MNKKTILMALALAAVALAWLLSRGASSSASDAAPVAATQRGAEGGGGSADSLRYATFAGGCFWCVEEVFDGIDGVVETTSGYTGGATDHPSYEQVSSGGTGHADAVRVTYDPARVEYRTLLEAFWRNIDPTTPDRQFCDRGTQYRAAVFYHDDEQKRLAEDSKRELEMSGRFERVVTQIVPAGAFWPAEEYHQDYYEKNPARYKFYKFGCGRARRLEELGGEKG